ncbi:hypothetical protein O2K51_09930 [Apibacter raozihei]|uniref:hypothetical protein n=1 Tax=Apibacter TaxID=1778601 RepID=UPI000FE43226|nr:MULTISPECIES: hypothetical protein [Apibacter]
MKFSKRLQLYLFGFSIGLVFITFVFGDKLFSWSYLPNDRVLAEVKTKKLAFSDASLSFLNIENKSKSYITDTVLVKGKIDFKKSHAQSKPCPDYLISYDKIQLKFTKCKDKVTIDSISRAQ